MFLRKRSVLLALLLASCTAGCGGSTRAAAPTLVEDGVPFTSVALLVDMSNSFAPVDGSKGEALAAVMYGLQRAMVERWDVTTISVLPITATSLSPAAICGEPLTFQPVLVSSQLGSIGGREPIHRREVLDKWFQECLGQVKARSRKPERASDISTAITVVSSALSQSPGRRVIIVISDFVEAISPGAHAATLRLSGEQMLMVYGPEAADSKNPDQMFYRIAAWRERLTKAGASRVQEFPLVGLTASRVFEWLH